MTKFVTFFRLFCHLTIILTAICLVGLNKPAIGQAKLKEPVGDIAQIGRPNFHAYTEKDGLPQNSITSMAFDHEGYLWVGTQDGAAYYNGRKWKIVEMPNTSISNYVRAIVVATDGSIWFGNQDGGLSRLKDHQWTTFDTSSGLPNNRVRSLLTTIASDGTQIVWVGTYGGGVACWQNDRWTIIDKNSGLPSNEVWSLLETVSPDGARTLWVGTEKGLARRQNGQWTI